VILDEQLARVPDATHFPTVPEIEQRLRDLHAQHRETTAFRTLGTSRGGQPISAIIVGNAGAGVVRHAVVTGTPHPNEPTGALGALALAELLVSDPELMEELGLQWHIVPCVDPDGAALNYGWYAGPYDRLNYAMHVYRPPFDEQYEWTFNRPGLPEPGLEFIPESRAVADLIDLIRPALLISMHNAEASGLFSYVSRDLPGLADALSRLAASSGLPVYQGVPEEEAPILGPGLFGSDDDSDRIVDGMLSSTGYAAPYGTYGVVCEPPMWIHPDTDNLELDEQTYGEVHEAFVSAQAAVRRQMDQWLAGLRPDLLHDSARGRAVAAQLSYLDVHFAGPHPPAEETDQRCTIAHAASISETLRLTKLRCAGHLLALLRDEAASGRPDPAATAVTDHVEITLKRWAEEEPSLPFVGLSAAPRMHVGMALEVAQLLAKENQSAVHLGSH
jgi:hypothetical protein